MSSAGDKQLRVVIGCDCDPDRPEYGGPRYDSLRPFNWRGVDEGIRALADIRAEIAGQNSPWKVTWCVRSDLQMRRVYDDCAWPYKRFRSLWNELAAAGDEIAWHPHLWRWDEAAHSWHQETHDDEWIKECLAAGHASLTEAMGRGPCSMRAGWGFHNNVTMLTVNQLGITVDFSAAPGHRTVGCPDARGSGTSRQIDWSATSDQPYLVSADDYRRAPAPGEASLHLVEIPLSPLRSRALRLVSIGRSAIRAKRGHKLAAICQGLRLNREHNCVTLTVAPMVFSRLIECKVHEAQSAGCAWLVAYFHADELLHGGGLTGVGFGLTSFLKNIRRISERATKKGIEVRFLTASEASAELELTGNLRPASANSTMRVVTAESHVDG